MEQRWGFNIVPAAFGDRFDAIDCASNVFEAGKALLDIN